MPIRFADDPIGPNLETVRQLVQAGVLALLVEVRTDEFRGVMNTRPIGS